MYYIARESKISDWKQLLTGVNLYQSKLEISLL